MTLLEGAVIDIVGAEQVSDYKLNLRLSDGREQTVDFEPFLRATRNPMIRAYLGLRISSWSMGSWSGMTTACVSR
jgi:hypothetical protein